MSSSALNMIHMSPVPPFKRAGFHKGPRGGAAASAPSGCSNRISLPSTSSSSLSGLSSSGKVELCPYFFLFLLTHSSLIGFIFHSASPGPKCVSFLPLSVSLLTLNAQRRQCSRLDLNLNYLRGKDSFMVSHQRPTF